MGKNSRSAARARAFQVLYSIEFTPVATEEALDEAFRQVPQADEEKEAPGAGNGFAWELVEGVWNNFNELDAAIGRHSRNWRVDRLGRVELTVLRLAMFELLHLPEVPTKVVINEALELAGRFANPQSKHFINGILDAAAQGRQEKPRQEKVQE